MLTRPAKLLVRKQARQLRNRQIEDAVKDGATVYDSQPGAPDSAQPTTVLKGSVVVHR